MLTMHKLDAILQNECPIVMVPLYGDLEPLAMNGHRFLAAKNGLFVDVRRPWLTLRMKFADSEGFHFPYGKVKPFMRFNFAGKGLTRMLHQFIAQAKETGGVETAAWLTYAPQAKTFLLSKLEYLEQGPGRVQYLRPTSSPDALPVVDCHSHASFPAFFSETDDQDDKDDDLKIAFVVGSLNEEKPTIAMRLVGLGGVSIDLTEWITELL
jgi:PRTRC genetic system protein A